MRHIDIEMSATVVLFLVFLPGLCASRENVAFGAKAVQSSTYNYLGEAMNAVDGNSNSDYMQGSCTHTDPERNPWWRVELPGTYRVDMVTITNRGDCCEERINGAQIRIGNSLENNGNNNHLAATIESLPRGATGTYKFAPVKGRFVNIVIPGRGKILTLCEVKVFSENVAFGAKAVQSSTYNYLGEAMNAVDGNSNSDYMQDSCTHTDPERDPWWRVELPGTYRVGMVTITNRGDCCEERINGAEIRIGNSLENNGNNNRLAATIESLPRGGTGTYKFAPVKGRFVNIIIPGKRKILTLCEVKVFADALQQQFSSASGRKHLQQSQHR
ncbi:uncharacterized protein LOC143486848 [Brachyhypopomus gauderio]|uniref:uncharacterized protein LOC143486848 n=1 Tax=Brachyhypopomus gauderio TaxID=698409 RepID=UPI004041AB65